MGVARWEGDHVCLGGSLPLGARAYARDPGVHRCRGRAGAEQLLHAVEPVLGDLTPLPASAAGSAEERAFWAALLGRWAAIAVDGLVAAEATGNCGSHSTVITEGVSGR